MLDESPSRGRNFMPVEQRRRIKAARRVLGVSLGLLPALGVSGSADHRELRQRGHREFHGPELELAHNGAASGEHFDLCIAGTPSNATATAGECILVLLDGSTQIWLTEGPFAVLDGDGTDGAAQLQLPVASPDADGVTNYSIFARAFGEGSEAARLTTCGTDPATGKGLCSTESLLLVHRGDAQRCDEVSKDLLTIEADIDDDGDAEALSLFDDRLGGFIWQLDAGGLRRAQLRFYPIE
jgi:hypothetical protein